MNEATEEEARGTARESARSPEPQLSLVLPVYNEADAIQSVIAEWVEELDRLGIDFELLAYDDGSADETPEILRRAAETEPRVIVTQHENRGHGPTILRGYREARGEWIFQTDSDGELTPERFERLWQARSDYDLVVGRRVGRRASRPRRAVSETARLLVRVLFGSSIQDVNCPYRLIRRSSLSPLLEEVPESPFAPNVLISGLAARRGLRVQEFPVPHRERRGGQVSLDSWRLLRGSLQTAWQALTTRFGLHGRSR